MTGSALRFISLVVLTAIMGISTARVICWIPCVLDAAAQPQAKAGAHCGHAPDDGGVRLIGGDASCESCDELRLVDADRLTSRGSVLAEVGISAISAAVIQRPSSARLPRPAATPPDRRVSAPVPLPLRI